MTTILWGASPASLSENWLARVHELAPAMRLVVTDERTRMEEVLEDVEIALGSIPHDIIITAPRLGWYQQWGAGADWLLRYPQAVDRSFTLTNVAGIHAIQISEHIFAMLLAFARDLHTSVRAQERRNWRHEQDQAVFELAGKTMLVIGVGAIGRRTAHLGRTFGMRVLGIRRNAAAYAPDIERMMGPERLHEALPEADFVVLTIPLTPETARMIGAKELRLMKPTAYLVNIGRGGTVDKTSLIQALQEKRIAGAGLDVFATEPLPPDSALWDMPNVIITAHYAGSTPQYDERAMAIFLDNLRRYMAGEPLTHVVNKRLGY